MEIKIACIVTRKLSIIYKLNNRDKFGRAQVLLS